MLINELFSASGDLLYSLSVKFTLLFLQILFISVNFFTSGSSEAVLENPPQVIQVTSGKVSYKIPDPNLCEASLGTLVSMLTKPDESARLLLQQLHSRGYKYYRDKIRKKLIEENRILYYSIFKNNRKAVKIPLQPESYIDGAFSSDGKYVVLLRAGYSDTSSGSNSLELRSIDQIKAGIAEPLENHVLIPWSGPADIAPVTSVTSSQEGNKFLITGCTRWYIWKLYEETLQHEYTIIFCTYGLYYRFFGSFNNDGSKLLIVSQLPTNNEQGTEVHIINLDSISLNTCIKIEDLQAVSQKIDVHTFPHKPGFGSRYALTVQSQPAMSICMWKVDQNPPVLAKILEFEESAPFFGTIESQDETKCLIYDAKKASIKLLDMRSGISEVLYKGENEDEDTPYDTVTISSCKKFGLVSFKKKPARLYDLEKKTWTELDYGLEKQCILKNMKHTKKNYPEDDVLQIYCGEAHLIDLNWPLNLLTLDHLILLSLIDKYGNQVVSTPFYAAILETIPLDSECGNLKDPVTSFFKLDSLNT